MATLVLSTVGNVLGGPIGGAIGALIGQSIDQSILGVTRQGPRLNDLAVQTSSYGTAIPRIYGRMRVAGSVIWATDLQEGSATQSGGKGQSDVETFTYSVSMAVALSSRAAAGVGRIWADGKLMRGAAGDFKVRTGFRFYTGDQDQEADPLIASLEGINETPAYRGLAIAIFEDLDLSAYGQRIPFLTFELIGDEEAPTVGAILADATGGGIESGAGQLVEGYAAHGPNRRSAVEPLVAHLGMDLRDRGGRLESGVPTLYAIEVDDLGCAPDGRIEPAEQRSMVPERSIPADLTVDYYDPARDYQVGRMSASAGRGIAAAEAVDLPMVLSAESARRLAEDSLSRRWAQRDRMTVRLPPHHMALRTGDLITLPGSGRHWTVRQLTRDAMIVIAELRAAWSAAPAIIADPGRPTPNPDIVAQPTEMALFDLPDLTGSRPLQLLLAAASATELWRPVPIEIAVGGSVSGGTTAAGETVMGTALDVLQAGPGAMLDLEASVDVELANDRQWLESCDDEALLHGANLAVIGREIIQFRDALAIGPRKFRLSHLVRGRFGSEWAIGAHGAGDRFAMLTPQTLRAITIPDAFVGSTAIVTAHAVGDGEGTSVSTAASGEALRPPSPVHPRAALSGGSLQLTWVRRSRQGYVWADDIDVPLGETAERYRVRVEGSGGSVEKETSAPSAMLSSAELAVIGSGAATVTVAMFGDRALSRAALMAITLP